MNFLFLKRVRLVISLLFFLLISFLFLDFTNTFSANFISGILYFQFVPSLIKFIQVLGLAATGFIFVIILTLLFGRIYCSTFCPLGTLQDIISYFSSKIRKKKFYLKQKNYRWLQTGILLVIMLFLVFGSVFMVNLLDPYSLFGKITSTLVRPFYFLANNVATVILGKTNIQLLFPVQFKSYSLLAISFSLLMLGLVGYLSYHFGRLYCNTVCPVGTVLGYLARFSFFKIRLDDSKCTSCGICGANCKASCIDTKNKRVDFSHCVVCFNCLSVCKDNGVVFDHFFSEKNNNNLPGADDDRRQFLKKTTGFVIGILALPYKAISQVVKTEKRPVIKENPVTPPGSMSIRHFTQNCTACQLCVSSCPTQVLQPSIIAYGLDGLFQPTMDYHTNFCNFECVRCGDICPTGAIFPILPEVKKLTQIGKSFFIKENCVVYTDETACGACSEHCPTKAVNMVFYKDKLTIPEVNNKICVGCGACEFACPTTPKSIYVDGQAIHQIAEKPVEKKVEKPVESEEDFPF